MFVIKRIVTVVSAVFGGALGLIIVAFLNWAFSLSLTAANLFLYGVGGGVVTGVLGSYLLTVYLMKKARRFLTDKFMGLNSRMSTLRRV
jgi:hypothetical protein